MATYIESYHFMDTALMNLRIHLSNGARDFTHQKCLRNRRLQLFKTQIITLYRRIFRPKSTRTAYRTRLSSKISSFSCVLPCVPLAYYYNPRSRGKIYFNHICHLVTLTLHLFDNNTILTSQSINRSIDPSIN